MESAVPTLDQVLQQIESDLSELAAQGRGHTKAADVFVHEFEQSNRRGSRFVGEGANESLVRHVADGGELDGTAGVKTITPSYSRKPRSLAAAFKALSTGTGSSGGYLVFPELAAEMTPLLRARAAVLALGAHIVPVHIELDVAGLSSGAAAYWVAENAAIPVSEETFDFTALLRPKPLAAMVPVSNRLLATEATSPALDQAIRADLSAVMALRVDLAFLRGTGTGGEPLGLRNRSGVTLTDLGGVTPDYDVFIDALATLRELNAPMESVGWIFSPKILRVLSKLKTSTGSYLTDAGLLTYDAQGAGGMLLGYPFRTTTQIPSNLGGDGDESEVYLGEWNELWVGQNQDLLLESSSEASYTPDGGTTWVSSFQNLQTLFRATMYLDAAPRLPQLFNVITGVKVPAS